MLVHLWLVRNKTNLTSRLNLRDEKRCNLATQHYYVAPPMQFKILQSNKLNQWLLVAVLAVVSFELPRLLHLSEKFHTGIFTPEAYAQAGLLFLSSILVTSYDTEHLRRWGVALGLSPLFTIFIKGPGNLWPIALILVGIFSLLPSMLGVAVVKLVIRIRRAPTKR